MDLSKARTWSAPIILNRGCQVMSLARDGRRPGHRPHRSRWPHRAGGRPVKPRTGGRSAWVGVRHRRVVPVHGRRPRCPHHRCLGAASRSRSSAVSQGGRTVRAVRGPAGGGVLRMRAPALRGETQIGAARSWTRRRHGDVSRGAGAHYLRATWGVRRAALRAPMRLCPRCENVFRKNRAGATRPGFPLPACAGLVRSKKTFSRRHKKLR